jgi:hypothetical protein
MLHFPLLGYYCRFSHFLEAVPFGQVILLFEDVLNRTLHPFLNLEPLVGDQFYFFPARSHAVVVKSAHELGEDLPFVSHLDAHEIFLGRRF